MFSYVVSLAILICTSKFCFF